MIQVVSRIGLAPPRVALVTGCLKLGGSTTFLCNLAGVLVQRGIPVQVFSFERDHPLASDFQRQQIPVTRQDEDRRIFEDRMGAVLDELKQFAPTAVVACLAPTSFETLRYLPPGILRLGMVQSDDPVVYRGLRKYAAWVDAVVGVSEMVCKTLRTLPEFSSTPVHYVPYGVPMPSAAENRAAGPDDPLKIIYLGRLEQEQKRVCLFPSILDQLVSSKLPFTWTVAGEGPERGFLERSMRPGGSVRAVRFTGTVLYADVPGLLSEHDVFLLASDYEGLPLSLLEAMGHGLVPVVSDLPSGIREVVDATTGIRVPTDDVAGYANALIWLHQHRPEREQMARNARERVRSEFSLAAMVDRWLRILPTVQRFAGPWPRTFSIQAPLDTAHPAWFSPLFRPLRRLRKRLRPQPAAPLPSIPG